MLIVSEHEFDAAHRLPQHQGACGRLHGHRYRLEVQVEGDVDAQSGLVQDFEELDRRVQALAVQPLDHSDLNERLPNPTAERIVVWMWEQLAPALPGLRRLRLWETARYSVIYEGR